MSDLRSATSSPRRIPVTNVSHTRVPHAWSRSNAALTIRAASAALGGLGCGRGCAGLRASCAGLVGIQPPAHGVGKRGADDGVDLAHGRRAERAAPMRRALQDAAAGGGAVVCALAPVDHLAAIVRPVHPALDVGATRTPNPAPPQTRVVLVQRLHLQVLHRGRAAHRHDVPVDVAAVPQPGTRLQLGDREPLSTAGATVAVVVLPTTAHNPRPLPHQQTPFHTTFGSTPRCRPAASGRWIPYPPTHLSSGGAPADQTRAGPLVS